MTLGLTAGQFSDVPLVKLIQESSNKFLLGELTFPGGRITSADLGSMKYIAVVAPDIELNGNVEVKTGYTFSAPNVYTKDEIDAMFEALKNN